MARFRYLGGENCPPALTHYGVKFFEDEVSELADPALAEKLRRQNESSHLFEEVFYDTDEVISLPSPLIPPPKRKGGRPRKTDEEKAKTRALREAKKLDEAHQLVQADYVRYCSELEPPTPPLRLVDPDKDWGWEDGKDFP